MITTYGYGFTMPEPTKPQPAGPSLGTMALVAVGLWWAWKRGWLKRLIAKQETSAQ